VGSNWGEGEKIVTELFLFIKTITKFIIDILNTLDKPTVAPIFYFNFLILLFYPIRDWTFGVILSFRKLELIYRYIWTNVFLFGPISNSRLLSNESIADNVATENWKT
jgi:hypothetical protein